MVDTLALNLFAVLFLILATAYFVVAEFAFVKIRSSRIEQLAQEGNKKALKVQKIIGNLDGYLSACQLGITVTALGLGWLGEPTVERILLPLLDSFNFNESFTHLLSFILSFVLVTFLHVVFGELAPKTIAIQKAEWVSLNIAGSIIWFYRIMYPFIWALNGAANLIVKTMGLSAVSEHSEAHSEEEIKLIVSSSNEINNDEKEMLEKIFDFDETLAREVMVHRKDMKCIYLKDTFEETMKFVKNSTHSRFPLVGEDKDDVKGYISMRDFYSNVKGKEDLLRVVRKIPKVYETTPIKKVLSKLQKEKTHIAIVLDEYGGVSGLVTMENIIEEIVGDIQDEFDNEINNPIRKGKDRWFVEADTHIEDVEKATGFSFKDKKDVVTIAGYIMNNLEPEMLKENEKIEIDGKKIEILKMEDDRIMLVSITKTEKELKQENIDDVEQ